MNRGPFIFIGVFAIIALSWALTLVKPIEEGTRLLAKGVANEKVPAVQVGALVQGQQVYRELGCVTCHTQQVRVVSGMDIDRGWGQRQTVALDYIDQAPVFTGYNRMGPDLMNVGARRDDENWHLLHLYNPQITSEGSNMPSYSFLFETREIIGQPSNRALDLPAEFATEPGFEVVPSRDAEALAAYLVSLNLQYDIEEAPSPEKLSFNK